MVNQQVRVLADASALAEAAADFIVERALVAVAAHDRFTIALTGGSTPAPVYQLLAQSERRARVPWERVDVFWSDDRAVPLTDDRSNYKLSSDTLLRHVPIPQANIRPMLSHSDDLEAAARHYARVIQSFVQGQPPRFDMVLLGMGSDGHCASLFPHSPQLAATAQLVVATPVAPLEPHVRRLTFTHTLINAAADVVFLVSGAGKAERLAQVLEGPRQPDVLPAQLIAPTSGTLTWFVDRAGVAKLAGQYDQSA